MILFSPEIFNWVMTLLVSLKSVITKLKQPISLLTVLRQTDKKK